MTEQEELLQEAEELLRSLGTDSPGRARTDAEEERAAPAAEESAEGGTEGGSAEASLSAVTLQAEAEQMLTALSREHAAAERLRQADMEAALTRSAAAESVAGANRQEAFSSRGEADRAAAGTAWVRPFPGSAGRSAAADAEAVDRSFERDARRYDGGFRMR